MRRKTKKEIITIINMLMEVQTKAAAMLQKKGRKAEKRSAEARKLLEQCQECAIQIGETIEKCEGMGTRAVSYLEEYCESLYRMSVGSDMEDGIRRDADSGLEQRMHEILAQVKLEVEEELPTDLLKVVFMPYKASMWDCMERVWEAAVADKECDARVVPIPFFERNQERGIERKCYEGGLFPSYVPVTHYGEFHLEEEQPDIIYIHNPYDNYNVVTSVHPEYYSFNLKKYTDMLVYVPYYFLGQGQLPETQCNLSAYQYVDKIIVQDEEKAKSLRDYVDEDKIAVLGSPKVDHILKLGRNRQRIIKHDIPREWRRRIGGKKVILFNISISGILQNSRTAMEKIRHVLSVFENREDVVLWWRPHPLTEATLKSMRPEMYDEYIRIKKHFLSGERGIFDDTSDPGIAVVVADAYVGEDSSSLIHYFGVLGKPVFFMDWNLTEEWTEEERASVFFYDCYFEDGCAWFVPNSDLGYYYLCKLDLQTGELALAEELPGKFTNRPEEGTHTGIIKIGESIILAPYRASDIYIYRFNTKQAVKIPLPDDMKPTYTQIFEYQGKAFLMPCNYQVIIELDIVTGGCIYYKIPGMEETSGDMEDLYGRGSMADGNVFCFPCRNRSAIWKFDLNTRTFCEKKIEEGKSGYSFLDVSGSNFWMGGDKALEIVCWNEETGCLKKWTDFPENFGGQGRAFLAVLEGDGGMIAVPRKADMAVKIKPDSPMAEKYDIQKNFEEGTKQSAFYTQSINYLIAKKYKEKIVALTTYNDSLVLHDSMIGDSEIIPVRFQEADRRKLENRKMDKEFQSAGTPNSYSESKRWPISVFVNYIADNSYHYYQAAQNCYKSEAESLEGKCGENLHYFVKERLG